MQISKPRALAAAFVLAAAVLTPAVSAVPVHAYAKCGKRVGDKDNSTWRATAGGANMRSGADTGCSVIGLAASGDVLDYHCYTWGAWQGDTRDAWTYARNTRTGVEGWLRTDVLSDFGSRVHCGS